MYHIKRFGIGKTVMFLALVTLFTGSISSEASAKEGEFGLTLAVGTGYVLGKSVNDATGDSMISGRNPTLLDLDFQYEILSWLAPSLRAEIALEGGGALTLVPGVVFDSDGDKVTFYGRFGVAIRLEPTWIGVDIGAGMIWHFLEHLGLVTEINVEPLFIGKDLTGGAVVPMLFLFGLRGNI